MPTVIHPTAIVEPGAQLGADCEIMAGAIVTRHCALADRVIVHPYAVIGGDPQYVKFDRSVTSGVRVGAGTVLREHVTVNRSIQSGGFTTVGEGCFLMAASHVAHDCAVGNQVVFANGALLAGHVSVGDYTFSVAWRRFTSTAASARASWSRATRRSHGTCRISRWWRSATM